MRPDLTSVLVRSLALGLATGARSSAGLGALALRAPLGLPVGPPARFVPYAVAGELVADKLPSTPSRLQPPVLGSRAVAGGLCGLVVARRAGAPRAVPVVAGALAAVGASVAGVRWRTAHPGVQAALAEDAVALGLAAVASR